MYVYDIYMSVVTITDNLIMWNLRSSLQENFVFGGEILKLGTKTKSKGWLWEIKLA